MPSDSSSTNDVAMNISTIGIPVGKLTETFRDLQITVDRIAGIFLDEATYTIYLSFINGPIDVKTKSSIFIKSRDLPTLLTWNKVGEAIFFEVDFEGPIIASSWIPVIEQLAELKDKNGNNITSFFGAGYGKRSSEQCVWVNGKMYWLTSRKGPKITSIRYDQENGLLFGIALDENNNGRKLVAIKASTIRINPTQITETANWASILEDVLPTMFSLSRTRYTSAGEVSFIVNHPKNFRRVLSISFEGTTFRAVWKQSYTSPFIVIGPITNTEDLFVGYRFGDTGFEIFFQGEDSPSVQNQLYAE